jgi:hypothetical protein
MNFFNVFRGKDYVRRAIRQDYLIASSVFPVECGLNSMDLSQLSCRFDLVYPDLTVGFLKF